MSIELTRLIKGLTRTTVVFALFYIAACSDEAPEVAEREAPVIQTPPPEAEYELETLHELFVGSVGCQNNPAVSLVNYNPGLAFDAASCDGDLGSIQGSNPSPIVSMNTGLYAYLDTEYDAEWQSDYLVFSEQSNVGLIDLANNAARGLRSFAGEVCQIIPAYRFEEVVDPLTSTSTWHKINQPFVYVETVSADGVNICSNSAAFRNYYKLPINFDAFASDFDTCASEPGGKNTTPNCKIRLLEEASAAQAHSVLIRGWVDDAGGPNSLPVAAYVGWGDNQLKLWDESLNLVWTQDRVLETFDQVFDGNKELMSNTLFHVWALSDSFYLMQLGRDHFVFQGQELIEASDPASVLEDRVYLADERIIAGPPVVTQAYVTEVAHTDNDVVIYDQGKFFATNYKAGYIAPTTALNYVFSNNLVDTAASLRDDFEFSQLDLTDCQFSSDEAACDIANDVEDPAWSLTSLCQPVLGCDIPVDNTDYCVTDAERVGSTPEEDLCTASRFQDLNELDDNANDLSFRAFVPYSVDFMRGLEMDRYGDKLLVRVRLLERDALILYDHNQTLADPKADREQRLFGERLNQIVMKPVVANNGMFVTSLVRSAEQLNRCYKGYVERVCELNNFSRVDGPTCTGIDVQLGICRASLFMYESRALFCSDAQIASDSCNDDNQVGTLERQIEGAAQDAKWLPTLDIDASGIEAAMSVLISDDMPATASANDSYIENEGVLGNPELYSVALPGVTQGARIAQLSGVVESIPQPAVFRNQVSKISVNQEEFTDSRLLRTQAEHYVDEALQSAVRVIDAVYEQ